MYGRLIRCRASHGDREEFGGFGRDPFWHGVGQKVSAALGTRMSRDLHLFVFSNWKQYRETIVSATPRNT